MHIWSEVIDRMTFNQTMHMELWNWLAENPGMEKVDWPCWKNYEPEEIYAINFCFACEACVNECSDCPIKWHKKNTGCLTYHTAYTRWMGAMYLKNYHSAKEYAIEIAELPLSKAGQQMEIV